MRIRNAMRKDVVMSHAIFCSFFRLNHYSELVDSFQGVGDTREGVKESDELGSLESWDIFRVIVEFEEHFESCPIACGLNFTPESAFVATDAVP